MAIEEQIKRITAKLNRNIAYRCQGMSVEELERMKQTIQAKTSDTMPESARRYNLNAIATIDAEIASRQ